MTVMLLKSKGSLQDDHWIFGNNLMYHLQYTVQNTFQGSFVVPQENVHFIRQKLIVNPNIYIVVLKQGKYHEVHTYHI